MKLIDFAREVFIKEKIEYVSLIPLSECKIHRSYLLEREGIDPSKGSAIMLAVPYYVWDGEESNISLYAVSQDYHLYFKSLFERVLPLFFRAFPDNRFVGFADHSPIDETLAAAKSGLGIIGRNHMLITEKYSSFVFLGEIICDVTTETSVFPVSGCENCGICEKSCPVGLDREKCISAMSQKKGELDSNEIKMLLISGSAWGCDICQKVCPHSKNPQNSEIGFWREKRIPFLTSQIIEKMSDEDFGERAYSWRGKNVILRNLRIIEGDNNE